MTYNKEAYERRKKNTKQIYISKDAYDRIKAMIKITNDKELTKRGIVGFIDKTVLGRYTTDGVGRKVGSTDSYKRTRRSK